MLNIFYNQGEDRTGFQREIAVLIVLHLVALLLSDNSMKFSFIYLWDYLIDWHSELIRAAGGSVATCLN